MPRVGVMLKGSLSFKEDTDFFFLLIQQAVAVSRDLCPDSGQLLWLRFAAEVHHNLALPFYLLVPSSAIGSLCCLRVSVSSGSAET